MKNHIQRKIIIKQADKSGLTIITSRRIFTVGENQLKDQIFYEELTDNHIKYFILELHNSRV